MHARNHADMRLQMHMRMRACPTLPSPASAVDPHCSKRDARRGKRGPFGEAACTVDAEKHACDPEALKATRSTRCSNKSGRLPAAQKSDSKPGLGKGVCPVDRIDFGNMRTALAHTCGKACRSALGARCSSPRGLLAAARQGKKTGLGMKTWGCRRGLRFRAPWRR